MPKPTDKDHVFVNTEAKRTVMLCRGCGYQQEVRLPMPVDQFCDILEGFQRRHVACRKATIVSQKDITPGKDGRTP